MSAGLARALVPVHMFGRVYVDVHACSMWEYDVWCNEPAVTVRLQRGVPLEIFL